MKTQRKLNHFFRVFAGCAAVPGQWFSAKKTWLKIGSLQTSKSGVGFFRPPGARALPPEARAAFLLPCKGRFHRNHKENEPTVSNFRRVRRCPGRDSGFQQRKVTTKFSNRKLQKPCAADPGQRILAKKNDYKIFKSQTTKTFGDLRR